MKHTKSPISSIIVFFLLALLLPVSSGCRKAKKDDSKLLKIHIDPRLEKNQLDGLPGMAYKYLKDSPIHWQCWGDQCFEDAKNSRRLVFLAIVRSHQSGVLDAVGELGSTPQVVSELNSIYVPTVLDADVAREAGIISALLSAEIKKGIQMPLYVWITWEKNPVTWLGVNYFKSGEASRIFIDGSATVQRLWQEDREYCLENSAKDNKGRVERLERTRTSDWWCADPLSGTLDAIRKCSFMYDDVTRSFDGVGGVVPHASLRLLATASIHPGIPAKRRESYHNIVRDYTDELLHSPMLDPIDGGVFTYRIGTLSWQLPAPDKDCSSQASMVAAFLAAYRSTGDEELVERARDIIAFSEKNYGLENKLFAEGGSTVNPQETIMWSAADLAKVLTPEELAVCTKAFDIRERGNLPSECDPLRQYAHLNVISMVMPLPRLAGEMNMTEAQVKSVLASATAKLLKARAERGYHSGSNMEANCEASMRMVSVYADMYSATREQSYLDRAIGLLRAAKETFYRNDRLNSYDKACPPAIGDARALYFALAIHAAMDVFVVSGEEEWQTWAEDLASASYEEFLNDGGLMECPKAARVFDIPVSDEFMLFGECSVAMFSYAELRLQNSRQPMNVELAEAVRPLPVKAIDVPVLYTDMLEAWLARGLRTEIRYSESLPDDLKNALLRLPLRSIERRPAREEDKVPAGMASVTLPDGTRADVGSAAELQQALLPSQ